MKRHQQILLGVLALQVILSVIVFWPRQVASSSGEPLFPDLTAEDVVALTIADNEGKQIMLRLVDGAWALSEAGNYPAREETIAPLIEKLVALDTSTVIARTEASHKQLEVAENAFQRRVDFETQSGETHTVFLGSAPRYTATHFRVEGSPEIYLTTDLSTWEYNTRAAGWVDTAYISIDQETLVGATLKNVNGTFTFVRPDTDWTLVDLQEDETIAPGKTNAIVRNASTLALTEPLGTTEEPEYRMDEPGAVVLLETDDGATHTLTVGSMNAEDNTYVVKSSGSPYYVRVSEFTVSAMVEDGREDFLTLPPTPEAVPP